MILTSLIMGAVVVVAATALAVFWNDIISWLKRTINKVKEIIRGIHCGVNIFIKKVREAVTEISKHYAKNGMVWEETTVIKKLQYSELPDEIKAKLKRDDYEYDQTEELQRELER